MSEPAVLCSLNVDVTDRLTNRQIDMTSDRPLVGRGGRDKIGGLEMGKKSKARKEEKRKFLKIQHFW